MKTAPNKTEALELLHVLAEDGIHRMEMEKIIHLSSSGAYTLITYSGCDETFQAGKNLGRFEEALAPFGFFRIHKCHVVNMQRIDQYRGTKGGGEVELTDGTTLPVSRLRKSDFLETFRKMASVTV